MATNKPVGDNARKGAVRKRSQLRTKTMGESTWTKRDETIGTFKDQKKAPAKKKFKGVRREERGLSTSVRGGRRRPSPCC